MIHMKFQDLFSLKKYQKMYFSVPSAAVVIGTLRLNIDCVPKKLLKLDLSGLF